MSDPAPKHPKRMGTLRWGAVILIILPIIGLLGLNGILATPWVCNPVEKKIQQRTQLKSSISRISVWPWSGVSIHKLQLELSDEAGLNTEEPILGIREINIDPVWSSLLSKDRQFKSITLDTPRLAIPAEVLVALLSSTPPAVGPPIAAVTQPEEPPSSPSPQNPIPATQPPNPSQAQPSSENNSPAANQPSPPPTTPHPPEKPTLPTRWIHLKNASFTCQSNTAIELNLNFDDINGSIPVAGKDNQSSLHIKKADLNGSAILTESTAELLWSSNVLQLKPVDAKLANLTCVLSARMMMTNSLPLEMNAIIPQQPLQPIKLPMNGMGQAKAITAKAHFIGALLSPATWQGELATTAESPTITVKNEVTHFDQGQSLILLRSGQLSCVDARLTSEKTTLIGNGTLLSDGRLAANLRMIAHPSITTHVIKQFFPKNTQAPSFTPLATPQRTAFDLEARGKLPHIEYTLGHGGPTIRTNISNPSDP